MFRPMSPLEQQRRSASFHTSPVHSGLNIFLFLAYLTLQIAQTIRVRLLVGRLVNNELKGSGRGLI
jgi:hypothetical protein